MSSWSFLSQLTSCWSKSHWLHIKFYWSDHAEILHMPQQHCCCGMCRISSWYGENISATDFTTWWDPKSTSCIPGCGLCIVCTREWVDRDLARSQQRAAVACKLGQWPSFPACRHTPPFCAILLNEIKIYQVLVLLPSCGVYRRHSCVHLTTILNDIHVPFIQTFLSQCVNVP